MKQYAIMVLIALGFTTIFSGCATTYEKLPDTHTEYLGDLDKKIRALERGLLDLNNSAQDLGKRVDVLSQKTKEADSHYLNLLNSLNGLSFNVEHKNSAFENTLAETQKTVKDLEKKMDEIEKTKIDLQNQLITLQSQRPRLTGTRIEQPAELKKEAKEVIEQGREMLKEANVEKKAAEDQKIKAIATGHEKEALQKLLDEALMLYREGNYKGAVGKWEEVLIIDPENLEAKFNIEIANEKIKSISEN